MDRSCVAIIIPAYNEETTIAEVVTAVLPYGQPIIVNDCSTDNTAMVAEQNGALVVNHFRNQGYDGALNSGFEEAKKHNFFFVITFDADGQHDPAYVEKMLNQLENGFDLVLGVRPTFARIAERVFSLYSKIRFGISDPLCGMKGYRMSAYCQLGYFDSYRSIGTELAFYVATQKKRFIEIMIPIRERKDVSRFGRRFRANYKILRATWLSVLRGYQ